jgi:hypothetical protein
MADHIVEMTPVESSNVAAVGYRDKTLYVEFKTGTIYRYKDVPEDVYTDMMQAESVGKFLHARIRNVYQYEKVD